MTITLWKFTGPFQNLLTLEKSVALILVLRSLYNKANDPLFNSLRKSGIEAQVQFTSKAMENARVTSLTIHLREKD